MERITDNDTAVAILFYEFTTGDSKKETESKHPNIKNIVNASTYEATYSKHYGKDECKSWLDGTLSKRHYATDHDKVPFFSIHFHQSRHRRIFQFFLL